MVTSSSGFTHDLDRDIAAQRGRGAGRREPVRSVSREIEIELSGRRQKRRAWLTLSVDNGAPVTIDEDVRLRQGTRAHLKARARTIRASLANAWTGHSPDTVSIEPFTDGPGEGAALDVVQPSLAEPGAVASPDAVFGAPPPAPQPAPEPAAAPAVLKPQPSQAPSPARSPEELAAPLVERDEAQELLQKLLAEDQPAALGLDDPEGARDLGDLAQQARHLQHRRQEDAAQPVAGEDDEEADAPATQNAPSAALSHAFFDRLGDNMRYSNTFDVGSFDLSERLRAFEHEVDAEEAARAFSRPEVLDDVDIAAELSAIQEARQEADQPEPEPEPEPAPAPAAPATTPIEPVLAGDGLSEGAAAAASIVANLHDLPRTPAAVLAGEHGWSVYERPPPASFVEAVDHFGLETANGDTARDPAALKKLVMVHGVVALGSAAADGPVRLVSLAPDQLGAQPGAERFTATAVAGQDAGTSQDTDHGALIALLSDGGQARPLVLAYA